MEWSEAIKEEIAALPDVRVDQDVMQRIVGLIDLTSLNADDTESGIAAFCSKATTPYGHVAAICVYPAFVRLAAATFSGSPIKTATVVNFPAGTASLESVLIEISNAIADGAQEVDVVFPYERYLAGERHYAHTFVASCKAACGDDVVLKVILETGALGDVAIIADACYDALVSGADFVKTSTGKISDGATLEAAATMLLVIRHLLPQLKRRIGLKVSGGIRTLAQAAQYVLLADRIMGHEWVSPQTFRIGASKLIDELA